MHSLLLNTTMGFAAIGFCTHGLLAIMQVPCDMAQKGVSHRYVCMIESTKGGGPRAIAHFWRSAKPY